MNLITNPFPGMNPYLESVDRWRGVHAYLTQMIRKQLNSVLPANYVADSEGRLIVDYGDDMRSIYPDVSVTHSERPKGAVPSSGGVAVLERESTRCVLELPHRQQLEETRQTYLTIRETSGTRNVITIIEVLSPTNKTAGNALTIYQQKQWETIQSSVHLIEIDLLRGGEHVVYPPAEAILANFGKWDYLVSLSRNGQRDRVELWLTPLMQRLPKVSVPLKAGDADVEFDLQEAIDQVYLDGAYARILDYSKPPPPPEFSNAELEWIKKRVASLLAAD